MGRNNKYDVAELLLHASVFRAFTPSERGELARIAVRKSYEKGEYLVLDGEVWPFATIVASGEINGIKISTEGRSLGTIKLKKGDGFWCPSFFDGLPINATLEVWESSTIFRWNRDQLIPMLKNNPEAMWELNSELIRRIRQKSELVESIYFTTIACRLARFLLNQFEGTTEAPIARNMSLEEIGAEIGTTPVMVCKHLYRFTENGLINVTRSEFELSNQLGLEKIAES